MYLRLLEVRDIEIQEALVLTSRVAKKLNGLVFEEEEDTKTLLDFE